MDKLAIVQCGDKKIWKEKPRIGLVAAKNAYTSPYFQKSKLESPKICYPNRSRAPGHYADFRDGDSIPAMT